MSRRGDARCEHRRHHEQSQPDRHGDENRYADTLEQTNDGDADDRAGKGQEGRESPGCVADGVGRWPRPAARWKQVAIHASIVTVAIQESAKTT